MSGPGEFSLLGPKVMAAITYALKSFYGLPVALHLDHGDSLEMVRECITSGYSSVMLDYSAKSFETNVEGLRKVVSLAEAEGISVEGELGRVGKADETSQESGGDSEYTDPEKACEYVERSGIDLLAVSIGNKHGFYIGEPHLEFDRLKALHRIVTVPLVMHGGTGIPEGDIQKSIEYGIAKVNVASELIHTYRKSLMSQWQGNHNTWTPIACGFAKLELAPIVEKWIHITGAAGMA